MKLSESLKVLAFLQPNQPIDIESVAEQSKMDRQKVNQAVALLSKSAIISNADKKLKIHVQQINREK